MFLIWGVLAQRIVHDYWLIRGLWAIAVNLPEDGIFRSPLTVQDIKKGRSQETQPIKGVWAFGGGTCLSSAWRVSPRWSEDIDAVVFETTHSSKSSFNTIRRRVTDMVADVVGEKGATSGGFTLAHTRFTISAETEFKVDHAVEVLQPEQLVVPRSVTGLIARYSDKPDSLCDEFPELGGFELPVIRPAYIAVNKLDALHQRAATERWDELRKRFRDIYDLYHIAREPSHADLCREKVSEWCPQTNRGRELFVERPESGYGSSPIFVAGSPAQEVLRDAYNEGIQGISIGTPPPFDEVITKAQELDRP